MDTKGIIKKWYGKLSFPKEYDEQFCKALDEIEVDASVTVEDYDQECTDGKKNLLYFLYFCENTWEKFLERGISEKIFIDTMQDIVVYTKIWTELKGELYLGQLAWLKRHHRLRIFALGRLQFAFGKSTRDSEDGVFKKDADIMEIHIPRGSSLDYEACVASIEESKSFFAKYFPEYEYEFITCATWLLGDTTLAMLSPESNIAKFASLFTMISFNPGDGIIPFVFGWGMKREDVVGYNAVTSLQKKVKAAIECGEELRTGYGYIRV